MPKGFSVGDRSKRLRIDHRVLLPPVIWRQNRRVRGAFGGTGATRRSGDMALSMKRQGCPSLTAMQKRPRRPNLSEHTGQCNALNSAFSEVGRRLSSANEPEPLPACPRRSGRLRLRSSRVSGPPSPVLPRSVPGLARGERHGQAVRGRDPQQDAEIRLSRRDLAIDIGQERGGAGPRRHRDHLAAAWTEPEPVRRSAREAHELPDRRRRTTASGPGRHIYAGDAV